MPGEKEAIAMKYAAKKLGLMLLTMLIVSFLAFLAFQIIPGDPTNTLLGSEATPERVAALRSELGLDRPFFVRYFDWIVNFVQGDFGKSYSYSMPVADMLRGKLAVTLLLAAISFLMTVLVSIPVGILCADRGGWLDRIVTVLGQATMAVPPFFIGILLTYLFGITLHWFVPGEFSAPSVDFWGSVGYLVFPAAAIALPRIAMTVKMLRSGIMGELNKDYVRTSHSRGNTRRATLYRHVLRNAVVPTVAFLAMTIADIVAGSVVVEQVFAIPGLGRLLLSSISNRDYPVVQAIIVLIAFWVVLVNFVADLINQRLDPRLRLQ
jgi:ABC-type dipeptide/oligopeptide/nickel transport system permease component